MDHFLGTQTDADGPISVPPGSAVKLNEINSISSYPHSISSPQLPVLDRWSRRYYTIINHSPGTQTDADGPISVPPRSAVKLNEINLISSYPHSISSPQLPVLERWYRTYYTTMDHSLGTQTNADGPISAPPALAVKLTQFPATPTVFHLPSSQSRTDGHGGITPSLTTLSAPRLM